MQKKKKSSYLFIILNYFFIFLLQCIWSQLFIELILFFNFITSPLIFILNLIFIFLITIHLVFDHVFYYTHEHIREL